MKYTSLDEACREVLIEHGIGSEHKIYRAIQLGISCIRSLNLDVSGMPKIIVLPVNPNDTIDLPDDFIDYVTIGFIDQEGLIRNLGRNDNYALPRSTNDCGQLERNVENISHDVSPGLGNITASEWYASHFRNGEPTGRFFGLGGGNNVNGYYTFDIENNFMMLSNCQASNIYLEYLADPTPKDGNYMLHPYTVEAVKQYIIWKMLDPNNEKQYILEKRRTAARFANFTMTEFLAAMRLSNKAAPRF